MWVFTNQSFLSVVQHRNDSNTLLVRSRIAGDIERAIPTAEVFEGDCCDYRYRAFVPRAAFVEFLDRSVEEIDYVNFKDSVPERKRKAAYMRVWQVMADWFGAYVGLKQELCRLDNDIDTFLLGP